MRLTRLEEDASRSASKILQEEGIDPCRNANTTRHPPERMDVGSHRVKEAPKEGEESQFSLTIRKRVACIFCWQKLIYTASWVGSLGLTQKEARTTTCGLRGTRMLSARKGHVDDVVVVR